MFAIILLILIIITWHCISICRNSNVIPDTVFLYFTFGYYDLHFTIIFKNSFVQPSYYIIILNILSFHSKMLKNIHVHDIIMLLSDISIFRFTINIGEHRVIVRGIMSLCYDILSFYFTSCYDTITSYDIAVLSYSYFPSFFSVSDMSCLL